MSYKSDKVQSVGRTEPEFKFNNETVVFIIIGFIVLWWNMLIIFNSMQSWSYLSIIFTTIIPTIIIALKNRLWGYGYLLGFAIAGIPFSIMEDLFVGWYTFATAIFIFIILWLVFWTAWRSLSSIKQV